MAHFVLHRNYAHASLKGHVINFKKGEPAYVPPECHREVIQIGAVPVDADGETELLAPEKVEPIPLSQEERYEQLVAAFELLEGRNKRRDFTGQGIPSLVALATIVDFDPSKKEVEDTWRSYREEKGAAQ